MPLPQDNIALFPQDKPTSVVIQDRVITDEQARLNAAQRIPQPSLSSTIAEGMKTMYESSPLTQVIHSLRDTSKTIRKEDALSLGLSDKDFKEGMTESAVDYKVKQRRQESVYEYYKELRNQGTLTGFGTDLLSGSADPITAISVVATMGASAAANAGYLGARAASILGNVGTRSVAKIIAGEAIQSAVLDVGLTGGLSVASYKKGYVNADEAVANTAFGAVLGFTAGAGIGSALHLRKNAVFKFKGATDKALEGNTHPQTTQPVVDGANHKVVSSIISENIAKQGTPSVGVSLKDTIAYKINSFATEIDKKSVVADTGIYVPITKEFTHPMVESAHGGHMIGYAGRSVVTALKAHDPNISMYRFDTTDIIKGDTELSKYGFGGTLNDAIKHLDETELENLYRVLDEDGFKVAELDSTVSPDGKKYVVLSEDMANNIKDMSRESFDDINAKADSDIATIKEQEIKAEAQPESYKTPHGDVAIIEKVEEPTFRLPDEIVIPEKTINDLPEFKVNEHSKQAVYRNLSAAAEGIEGGDHISNFDYMKKVVSEARKEAAEIPDGKVDPELDFVDEALKSVNEESMKYKNRLDVVSQLVKDLAACNRRHS